MTDSVTSKTKNIFVLTEAEPVYTKRMLRRQLINAAIGKVDEGLIFCGENVHRIKGIVSVESVMKEFA